MKKKNPDRRSAVEDLVHKLIPASYFKSDKQSAVKENVPVREAELKEEDISTTEPVSELSSSYDHAGEEDLIVAPKPEIKVRNKSKRVSGLSISSLKAKKAHELSKIEVIVDENDLPQDPFSEEEMQKYWKTYVHKLDSEGKKDPGFQFEHRSTQTIGRQYHMDTAAQFYYEEGN